MDQGAARLSTDSPKELTLFDPSSTESEEWPLIYVATPMTNLDLTERQIVSSWCEHVRQAALDFVRESGKPWRIRVHLPHPAQFAVETRRHDRRRCLCAQQPPSLE
jgi:hypothetical protein